MGKRRLKPTALVGPVVATALLLAVVFVLALGDAGQVPATSEETKPTAPASSEAGEAGAANANSEVSAETMTQGGELFAANCAVCHGPNGEGDVGPALGDPARVEVESEVIRQVLRGSMYMPAFGQKLEDEQIAVVITFVRNSFGNAYGLTTPEEVTERR